MDYLSDTCNLQLLQYAKTALSQSQKAIYKRRLIAIGFYLCDIIHTSGPEILQYCSIKINFRKDC